VQRLEQLLRLKTGRPWSVRLEKKSGSAPGTNGSPAAAAPPARVRPIEAMQQHPVLKRAIELFDALPVFLDPGFGEPPQKPANDEAK
jgi:hypothetical protein